MPYPFCPYDLHDLPKLRPLKAQIASVHFTLPAVHSHLSVTVEFDGDLTHAQANPADRSLKADRHDMAAKYRRSASAWNRAYIKVDTEETG